MRRVNSVTRGHPISICLIMAAGMMVILLSANANAFTCANGNGEEMASGPMLVAAVNNGPDSALAEVNSAVNQVAFVPTENMTAHNLAQNTTMITTTGTQTNSYTGIEVAMRQNDYRNHYADVTGARIQGETTTRMPVYMVNNGHTTVLTWNHGSGTPRLMTTNSDLWCNTAVSAASRAHVDATRPASSI